MPAEYLESATANADAMLVNWKLHLPREKQSVIDKNEEIDEILFQAHNLLQM
jgi:F0F1-type ATP synthase gamma subunit